MHHAIPIVSKDIYNKHMQVKVRASHSHSLNLLDGVQCSSDDDQIIIEGFRGSSIASSRGDFDHLNMNLENGKRSTALETTKPNHKIIQV